ncbi:MAG: glycosyltransferase family 2 protein [Acholeplasma sp.]|nr:glycosyltransferase family 2 protein [Acholeplasma sp.]
MIKKISNDVKISIIMPLYNAEKYVSRSIQSVLDQTHINFELIIINDCSTDNSLEIVKSYTDERIILLNNVSNLGVAKSRNIGLKKATGDFISFLDSDDEWKKSKLAKQLEIMQENEYLFTYTNYDVIDSDNNIVDSNIKIPKCLTFKKLLQGNSIGCLTVMVDAKYKQHINFKQIGHEDYLAWLELIEVTKIAYGINEKLAFYRVHSSSLSKNKIKAAKWTYNIYKNELKLGLLKSIYYFIIYGLKSVFKTVRRKK